MFTIYGRSYCSFCKKAVQLVKRKQFNYNYINLDNNEIKKVHGKNVPSSFKTIPIIFKNNTFIGGYTELLNYIERKKTKKSKKNTIEKMEGKMAPKVVLKTRKRLRSKKMKNNFKWNNVSTNDLFKNKRVVLFSLPGAYTPTCSSSHLPDYEKYYNELKKLGIHDVYCISVNDAFVMYNWGKHMNVKHVKLLPDGNGLFTKKMGALVKKTNLGFGDRSWRYSMYIENGKIKKIFSEKNKSNNHKSDPFSKSDVKTMIKYLQSHYKN